MHPFVLVTDRAGHVSWMNDRLRDQLLGEEQARLPESAQVEKLWNDAHRHREAPSVALDIQTSNGTRTCVDASAFDLTTSGSGDSSCVVIARPSPAAPASCSLEGANPMVAQLVESSPNGVIAVDLAGYVTYANSQAADFLGRREDELVGRPAGVFLSHSPSFAELLAKLARPSGWNEFVFELDRSGESIWLSASTRPIRHDDGSLAGIVTYLQDVTKRHLVEEELKQKNHELESYVDSVAHDLRSPLVSLLGFTRLLREDFGEILDDTGNHFLDRVEQAGRTMDALIHDLLELSRIREPGEIRPLLDPRPVLLQLAAELKLRLEEHGVVLELPEAPPMMRVDGTRLYQVFSNLVGNALRHAFPEDHREDALIRIDVRETDGADEIIVSDNGVGIRDEDQDRIFEVLQTGRGVRRSEKSHGIGLAIVKKIATSHGGRVWVESDPDHGARFHVRFPRS